MDTNDLNIPGSNKPDDGAQVDTDDDATEWEHMRQTDNAMTAASVATMAHGLNASPIIAHLNCNKAGSCGFHVPHPADDSKPGALAYAASAVDGDGFAPGVRDALRRNGKASPDAALVADLPDAPAEHRTLIHNAQMVGPDRGTGWDQEHPAASSAFLAKAPQIRQLAEEIRRQHRQAHDEPLSIDASGFLGEKPGWLDRLDDDGGDAGGEGELSMDDANVMPSAMVAGVRARRIQGRRVMFCRGVVTSSIDGRPWRGRQ